MRDGYQSLGWWMRRPTGFADGELNDYYTDVVGLPLLRRGGGLFSLFWAGEDLVFEIKVGDDPGDDEPEPLLPIFRSHDLDATRARFAAAGFEVEREEVGEHVTTVWVRGADRRPIGFEQRGERSPFAADAEALRRWRAGPPPLGDGPPLAPELQYLSRARRRVADVPAAVAFYRDVAGLDPVGVDGDAHVLSLGDTVLLELVPGGRARPVPADRSAAPDAFVSRVHGFDAYVDGLGAAGATWVGEQVRYDTGSTLAYLADPEGQPVGIASRTLAGNYPDDVEAERRWKLRVS